MLSQSQFSTGESMTKDGAMPLSKKFDGPAPLAPKEPGPPQPASVDVPKPGFF